MAITDFPWFKIYAAETLSDENFASWTPAERGVWFTLLCHCWKEGSIPADLNRLARLCSCNADAMPDIWVSIADRFHEQPGTGRLICLRLEFERQQSIQESEGKSQHGKKAANARWNKYKSDILVQCPSIAQPMPADATQPKPQPQPKRKKVPPKIMDVSLESMLDGKGSPLWEAYWKLAGIFGPAKNPAPKVTARLYHLALDSGFKVEHLHQKALELMKATSEQKFLPQLAKWLEGEGYQNPANAPINGGTNGTKPHHRSASDESYLEDVLSRPPAPIQQYTPEEFERLWGSGKAESLG